MKGPGRQTDSLRLLTRLVEDDHIELIGNAYLVAEIGKYAEVFPSITAAGLLHAVVGKLTLVAPDPRFTAACLPYFAAPDLPDLLHGATCLQTGALLISNDRHFDRIAKAGVIRRMTLTEAVRALL